MSARPAAFLDRDGILNELVLDPVSGQGESPLHVADVRLAQGAAGHVDRLRAAGYVVVVVTNQPAAAKGLVTLDELEAVHREVVGQLEHEGAGLDGWRVCFHHPAGVAGGLGRACGCRKPAAGLLRDAAAELDLDLGASWMIGDTDTDVLAGRVAGCRTVLVANPASAHKRSGGVAADAEVSTLGEAVRVLLAAAQVVPEEASDVA